VVRNEERCVVLCKGEEATEEGEQDASQDGSASTELSPQVEQFSPVELPTSLSAEQRCELSRQGAPIEDGG